MPTVIEDFIVTAQAIGIHGNLEEDKFMKKNIYSFLGAVIMVLALSVIIVSAQIASGGSYTLNQAVIANGGGTSSDAGNLYKVEGTSGQSAAGTFSSAVGTYSVRGGFWPADPLAPTAARVSISGRVIGVRGESLRNIVVTLEGGDLFTPRTTRTNSFGNFTFEEVTVGEIYTITVKTKRYGFPQDNQIISLMDSVSGIIFQAGWEN